MSESVPEVFDTTMHNTQVWFDQIKVEMNCDDNCRSYRAMRMVIHALPYRLSVTEAADPWAKLPVLVRGIFNRRWSPFRKSDKAIDGEEFLSGVENVFAIGLGVHPERVICAALGVLQSHVTTDESVGMKNLLPVPKRQLWPDHTLV